VDTDMTGGVGEKYDPLIPAGRSDPRRVMGTAGGRRLGGRGRRRRALPLGTGRVIDMGGRFHLRTL
jgi:hypothetical protein